MIQMSDILERVDSLAPLPNTAIKLMNVVHNPASTIDDIVDAIRYDQAVTTEVLKLCNSAYFGVSRQVTSLNDAMMCLGTVKVLQMVMAVHTNSMLSKAQHGYGLEPGMLWKHSVAVALGSAEVAQRMQLTNIGLPYTAGLLHDIGKVVLNEYVGEAFGEIVLRVREKKLSFVEAEREVLGFSHEQVGALLAEQWKLPDQIVRCVRYHHEPGEVDPPDPLIDTVYIADLICMLFGLGLGEDGLHYRADETVMQRNSLGEQDLETIGLGVLSGLKEVEAAFSSPQHDESPAKSVPVGK
ncbi:MAG: HDOD domain-containing protein [bacterium]|nr:HDOD domain-containing protein [bacterium]